jgi:hypothetical protein
MLEVKQGTAQKAGVDPAIRDVLVAGWDGNKADKDAVPDMCAAERHKNLGVIARQKMIDQAMDLRAMSHMNKSQTDALEAALFQRVTLIQGPPGTGKTHTGGGARADVASQPDVPDSVHVGFQHRGG